LPTGALTMESQNKTTNIVQSIFSGIGVAVLYLLLGTILDYVLTQILSQYFILDCSEDCYFKYFNALFIVVALLSVAAGIRAGMSAYKRSAEKQ
jgi:succinate dehydrogenase/fumarate reductase cytochrome b subunit